MCGGDIFNGYSWEKVILALGDNNVEKQAVRVTKEQSKESVDAFVEVKEAILDV